MAAWVVGVGQPQQSDSCGTQHCQHRCWRPASCTCPHLCTLSSQGDKPKHHRPPFLMLMLLDDSFTRCDSHPLQEASTPMLVSHLRLQTWAWFRMEPVGDRHPSPIHEISCSQVADPLPPGSWLVPTHSVILSPASLSSSPFLFFAV